MAGVGGVMGWRLPDRSTHIVTRGTVVASASFWQGCSSRCDVDVMSRFNFELENRLPVHGLKQASFSKSSLFNAHGHLAIGYQTCFMTSTSTISTRLRPLPEVFITTAKVALFKPIGDQYEYAGSGLRPASRRAMVWSLATITWLYSLACCIFLQCLLTRWQTSSMS